MKAIPERADDCDGLIGVIGAALQFHVPENEKGQEMAELLGEFSAEELTASL